MSATPVYYGDLRELALPLGEELPPNGKCVYGYCPYHDDKQRPSLAIYADHAYCYTCAKYMGRVEFSSRYSEAEHAAVVFSSSSRVRVSKPQVAVNPTVLAASAHVMLNTDQQVWFNQRGLNQHTIDQYWLGHYGVGYTLPVFDREKNVITVRFRRDDEMGTPLGKYWGLRGMNQTYLYPFHGPVPQGSVIFLTEGEFDALLLRQEGLEAYSLTNGANAKLSKELLRELLGPAKRIILVRDQDEPGREATVVFAQLMREALPRDLFTDEKHIMAVTWDPLYGKDATALWQWGHLRYTRLIERLRAYQEETSC